MEVKSSRPVLSLRVKLVLSYLVVALGAILLLVLVVSLAVQNYFYKAQQDQLRANAEVIAQQTGQYYYNNIVSWNNLSGPLRLVGIGPYIYVVVDTHLQVPSLPFPAVDINNIPAFRQALQQALQGQEVPGELQFPTGDGGTLSTLYISLP